MVKSYGKQELILLRAIPFANKSLKRDLEKFPKRKDIEMIHKKTLKEISFGNKEKMKKIEEKYLNWINSMGVFMEYFFDTLNARKKTSKDSIYRTLRNLKKKNLIEIKKGKKNIQHIELTDKGNNFLNNFNNSLF